MITNVLLILFALLLFGLIIFVHEFGHFFTAKLSGIRVNEFAIGMGPQLFSFQKGETKYSLRLLPIGGYCAMEGEDESSDDERAFGRKPVWKRIIVVCAGAVMNILMGIVLMMILLGQQPAFTSTTISQFAENSALQQAGMQEGDQFYSVGGYRVYTDRDLSFSLATSNPQSIDFAVVRDGKKLYFHDVKMNTRPHGEQQVMVLDFYVSAIQKNPITLIQKASADTVSVVRMVWYSLVGLVSGQFGLNDMAGPIGAADAISQAASIGLKQGIGPAMNNIVMMMTMITVNLGVVNLLPLPALDGGRLIFLLIELVRRRPINPKYEGWVHAAGFALLMTFMLIITYSDILRLFTGKGLGG
ncbi:M50 family metallopeptidase [Clostridium minihomine]|uniref:M50 family metallopeptidase n=1 Tax=Clostridium minihomine TaxID=2045012 RepID=UPI000C7629AF|nr:M50 family metallopeptidase [Clostridium minihomine]